MEDPSPQPLELVAQTTEAKTRLDQDFAAADRAWREAIRAAVAAGERVVEIAAAAGITRDRVYQIRDGRR